MSKDSNNADKNESEVAVKDLVSGLTTGNDKKMEDALTTLGIRNESGLYSEVGEIARAINLSLSELKGSLDPKEVNMNSTNIPDAATKLQNVMSMTHDAANKTLEIAEMQVDEMGKLYTDLDEFEKKIKDSDISKDLLLSFFEKQKQSLKVCQEHNSSIVMAQEFQDLSGQALKKVIKLVTEIEVKLVNLLKIFGEDPNAVVADSEEVLQVSEGLDQDDVDAVLKNLGF